MKFKLKTSALVVLFSVLAVYLKAQNCEAYYPMKVGATWEMKNYDDKDKLTGTTKSKVTKSEGDVSNIVATIWYEMFNAKDVSEATGEYNVKCSNGAFSVNMKNMLNSKSLEAYKDMQVTITGDDVEMPVNPTVGQTLKDANLNLIVTGMAMMNMTVKMYNRKVAAIETVTTPAGTFEKCVKITFNVKTHMMFDVEASGTEWYAKGIGMVKSESYDAKGKKTGSSVLNSYKQ
jgi:hypothetical protein